MTTPRPRFRDDYHVAVLPGDGVFLLSEAGRKRLVGPLFEALAPLLDGSRTADQIAESLSSRFPAPDVYFSILSLKSQGLLSDGPPEDPRAEAYWHVQGSNLADAARRLDACNIGVLDINVGRLDEARACFERHGLELGEPAKVLVVLVDDYLNSQLGTLAGPWRSDGQCWIPVQPFGVEPMFGPLFLPGEGPCYRCLEHRLRGNRPVDEMIRLKQGMDGQPSAVRGAVPSSVDATLALFAARMVAWIGTDDSSSLASTVTTFQPAKGAFASHRVERRPQCPGCGDRDLYRKQVQSPLALTDAPKFGEGEAGSRVVALEETVQRFEGLLSHVTGVVRDLKRIELEPPGPIRLYTASHAGPALPHPRAAFYGVAGEGGAGGKGLSDMQARASALGESIERASGIFQGDEVVVNTSFASLGDQAIHPNACMLFSDHQYACRDEGPTLRAGMHAVPVPFDPDVNLDWTPVWSLTHERHRLLPTQYLYFAHPGPDEHAFAHADSNGNACGNTLEEAILQGFFEVVERDAVSIWWYNRLRMPALDLASIDEPRLRALFHHYEQRGRAVHVLDLTHDLGVPVYAAVSSNVAAASDEILIGFGAHLDPLVALSRAVTEMNQMLAILEGSRGGSRVQSHLAEWFAAGALESHPYLIPAEGPPARLKARPAERDGNGIVADIRECCWKTERAGLELLVLDQTRPDLRVPVTKVIVPGLRHFWTRLAPGRLYDIPVVEGLLENTRSESEMNPLPMFL